MRYDERMRMPDWTEKRKQRLEIDKYECRTCGSKERLEVHHKPESYKKMPNESVEDDLTTLCVECHDLITDKTRRERYEGRPIMTEAHPNNERKKVSYELEKIEVLSHRSMSDNIPQRSTIKSDEPIFKGN